MKKRFFAVLLCLCLLIGIVPNMGTTAFAAGDYKIGDTVEFAGHEWYIIGTPDEGVTAPSGCYTLFAKNNEFGSTTFRASGDTRYIDIVYYKDSDLQKKMTEIANGFSEEDRNNIQPRTLKSGTDGIVDNRDVDNQYLWPLSYEEFNTVRSLRIAGNAFVTYWSRTGIFKDKSDYGVWRCSDAAFLDEYIKPNETYNVRPALYVKQEAVKLPTVQPHIDFYLSADTISNASVGGNLVANSGDDTPLTRSENQNVDVSAYSDGGTTQYGTSLLFHFSSATIGANQVVACVLTDEDGNVKYYGKLADWSDSAPDVDDVYVPLEGVAMGTYTLSIFSHNTATGEISEPSPTMTVTVVGSIGFVSNYDGKTYTEIVIQPNPGPDFTQHPQDQIIEENGSATFTAEADRTGITYYWQAQPKSSDPDTGTWYDIQIYVEGGVSVTRYSGQSLSLSNVSGTWEENGYTLSGGSGFGPADARFRCCAYTGGGTLNSYSNPADLTVIPSGGGEDGREVELRTNGTHIQWRYEGEGDDAWRDLVALSAITGEAGADGREIQLQVANGYIQWKYDTDTAWQNLLALSDLQGQDGEDGREIELRNNGTTIQWRYVGEADTEWKDLVDLSAITGSDGQDGSDGADGREVELRVDSGYIQWKYDTDPDTEWKNLIAVSALQGLKGDKGDKGADGADGTDGADGKNGSNGSNGTDGKDGRDGSDGLTPYIGGNGNWWIGSTDTGVRAEGGDGRDGQDGADGKNGSDSIAVADIEINEDGELIVTFTDGTVKNLGRVPDCGQSSNPSALLYLCLGISGLSLAGLIALLIFLYRKRDVLLDR